MSWAAFSHPSFWLFAGAAVAFLLGRRVRPAPVASVFAILALVAVGRLHAAGPRVEQAEVAGFPLVWLRADDLSLLFALVFSIVALLGLLYGAHRLDATETAAALAYAGAAIATVFAGDWITFFVFWEFMALTSLVVIWKGGAGRARRAGMRYLMVHAAGGGLLFLGVVVHAGGGGGNTLAPLSDGGAAYWLVLVAVAVNAAIPPLHAWLTDAYPEASTTGSVFLSAFTTKTAVYALIRLFPGEPVLVAFGAAMALYGVVYALLENDIRRLLGYHIVSQVGYMVAAVGIGTPLALNGAAAHAYSHILYKALLFMGAGAAIEATGRRRASELGGIARAMPWPVLFYIVGALSISGAPLFNGFISKSMIVSAAGEAHFPWTEALLGLASVGTFLSVGLKLPWFSFFGPDRGVPVAKLPFRMVAAMGIAAGLCVLYGVAPGLLYDRLPFDATYEVFTTDHVVSTMQLLLGAGLVFWFGVRRLAPAPHVLLDADQAYRGPGLRAARAADGAVRMLGPLSRAARMAAVGSLERLVERVAAGGRRAEHSGRAVAPRDPFSFRRRIGLTVLGAATLSLVLVLFALAALLR